VKWGDLRQDDAEGETYQLTDDSFLIILDGSQNTSERKGRDTLKHEACHVATWKEEPVHGPKFQACMSRRID